jgi:hypothetical protein
MATSPIYGWLEPDNTDLVKNGALAIRTLGNAIDTTMGTMVAKTIIDAKGDLIAGSAADTALRLAVGNNGETLVADSSTSTGLRYQSGYNGNVVINGGMDIWQRGTSFTSGGSAAYCADRWNYWRAASAAGMTVSRQTSTQTGFQYALRVARDVSNTGTGILYLQYNAETADSYRFAGQTVTLSFYAKAGANYSSASSVLNVLWQSGTGTDQTILNGFTGASSLANTTATLTTSWQRFSYTATVSSSATQLGLQLYYTPVGTAGAADNFEITGVQMELGSVATQFKRSNGSGGTIQGELAACQRYYLRITPVTALGRLGAGNVTSSTGAEIGFTFPVTMRTSPTALEQSGTATDYSVRSGSTNTACSAVPAFNVAEPSQAFVNFTVASGLTTGQAAIYRNPNTAGYLGWSAEL